MADQDDAERHRFINRLRIMNSLDGCELDGMSEEAEARFIHDPFRSLMRADDHTTSCIWAAIKRREPANPLGVVGYLGET